MRYAIMLAGLLGVMGWVVLAFAEVPAEQRYLTDTIKVTMRSGPGSDHKIKSMITIGQPVTVLEKGQDWTRIQRTNGQVGWVLTRFVTSEKPNRLLVETLQEEYADMARTCATLKKENKALQAQNQSLDQKVNVIQETTQRQIDRLTQENQKLKKQTRTTSIYLKFFLAGGGILLLGILIGYRGRKSKRRSSYYL